MPTYLTPAGAEGLRRYRYVGADHSLLYKYLLSPWAEWVLQHAIPRGAAPNTITLVGLLAQVVAFVVLLWHVPTMTELPPAWTGALAGAALFVYTTLDNVDGKQARRVGASSPLGLLFDHGCDAINSGFFGPVIMMMVMGSRADGWRHLLSWLLATVPFFFTTWEEYWTHEFHLPLVNGPNEGLAILATGYAVTAWLGPAWWRAPATHPGLLAAARAFGPVFSALRWCAGEPALAPGQPPENLELLLAVPIVGIVVMAAANLVTVTRHIRRTGGEWATVRHAYAQTLPYGALLLVAGWWLHTPVTKAAVTGHPYMFYAAVGGVFAELTSKLQVAHVCDQPYAPRWAAVAALAAAPALAALQSPQLAGWVAAVGHDGVRAALAAALGAATEM
jgi:ethanolaminephosphotransferase